MNKDTLDTANYIFQKKNYNSYQCGAYAIYNAILCNAMQTDIRHDVKLKYLIKKCKAQKGIGTLVTDFNATLESININIKPVEATLGNIKRAFATGGLERACATGDIVGACATGGVVGACATGGLERGVVGACATGGLAPLLFHWTQGAQQGNHYALIDKMYYKYGSYSYRVINYSFDKPIKIISERELKSMLMPYKDEHFQLPQLWCV